VGESALERASAHERVLGEARASAIASSSDQGGPGGEKRGGSQAEAPRGSG